MSAQANHVEKGSTHTFVRAVDILFGQRATILRVPESLQRNWIAFFACTARSVDRSVRPD